MKILLATNNINKVKELKQMIEGMNIELITLKDLNDFDNVEETGTTFSENAFLKADYFFQKYKLPTIADDSGLVVDALNGMPGVYSNRYSSEEGNYVLNNQKLLSELKDKANRKAYFTTTICYINKSINYFEGRVEGRITKKTYGDKGFGYDPLFIPDGYSETFAQMTDETKNRISHRYNAFIKLVNFLNLEKALENAKEILHASEVVVKERLLGGMSNYTYVIEADKVLYTLRILGEGAEKFVNRNHEKNNYHYFEDLDITNKTVYFNENTGMKISHYLEGTPLSLINEENYPYQKIAELLKKIHYADIKECNAYKPFERLEEYENHIINLGFSHPSQYKKLHKYFYLFKEYLENIDLVFCHGDSQPSNFILNNEDLYIVDFEFVGLNDPIYDIACFSNIRMEDGLKLLEVYFNDVTKEQYLRFYLWRCYQAFQWYNVAMYKELTGLSLKLHIDFKKVSENYLTLISTICDEIDKIIFDSEKK